MAQGPSFDPPSRAVFMVQTLEQAKLLTDNNRLRLLRVFAEGPRTTKQVADLLGEPATRLYRHVDALLDAGLIELVEERRKRGTTERYLRAVARRFEIDQALFGEAGGSSLDSAEAVGDLFTAAKAGVSRALKDDNDKRAPLLVGAAIRARLDRIEELAERMTALIGEFEADECDPDMEAEDMVAYGLLIALYPESDE